MIHLRYSGHRAARPQRVLAKLLAMLTLSALAFAALPLVPSADAHPEWRTYLSYRFNEGGTSQQITDHTADTPTSSNGPELANHGQWKPNNGVVRAPSEGGYYFEGWTAGEMVDDGDGPYLRMPQGKFGGLGYSTVRVKDNPAQMNPYGASFRVFASINPDDPSGVAGLEATDSLNITQKGLGNGDHWKMELVLANDNSEPGAFDGRIRCEFRGQDAAGNSHTARVTSDKFDLGTARTGAAEALDVICVWDSQNRIARVEINDPLGDATSKGCTPKAPPCHQPMLETIKPGGNAQTRFAYIGGKPLDPQRDANDMFAGWIYKLRVSKLTGDPTP